MTSYSTAWIRKLRKSDLEWELARINLSTEGAREELRRRLTEYVRAHPEQYIRVNWIFQLDEVTLKAELEDCGLDVTGSKEDLTLRLFQYVRDHPEEFLKFPSDLGEISQGVEGRRPLPLDTVWKLGLKFTPDDSVHTFFERLGELKLAYDVSDESMVRAVPVLLKGQAVLWFRNNQSTWDTWEDFLINFKDRYLPAEIDDVLTEEIRVRTQGADESVADYVTAIRTLMRRLTKAPTPAEQLRLLMKNLRPEVRLYIRDCDVNSFAELLAMGKQYEQYKREKERFRPPPDIAQALIPEVAYRPKKSGTVKKLTLLNSATKPDSKGKDRQAGRQTSTPLASRTKTCWNCNKPGHFFSQCKQSKRTFCHICGRPDTIAATCGCQRPRTTGRNRSQQDSAASSPQRVGTLSRKTREYHRRDGDATGQHHNDWNLYLREFAYALNTAVHSATDYTPAYLNLDRELKLPSVMDASEGSPELDPTLPQEWAEKISALRDIYLLVRDNLEEAYEKASRR
ncbi:uncharacterized protein LOC111870582 [Cryptotermes secundus]|uniref:uncharacterized protein LOC111870582 n=1 Tax=Cryptotermes secundus TaxID=105785 RepID=UPI000CD7C2EF|nr:uncharacterized protein LOC111870582 [Cryptotermes secundus]